MHLYVWHRTWELFSSFQEAQFCFFTSYILVCVTLWKIIFCLFFIPPKSVGVLVSLLYWIFVMRLLLSISGIFLSNVFAYFSSCCVMLRIRDLCVIKQFGYLLCFYAILLKNGQGKNSVPKCRNFVQCFLPVVYDI